MLFSQCKGDIVDMLFFAIRLRLTSKKEQNRGKNGCQRVTMVFQMTQKIFWTIWLKWRMLSLPEIFHKDEL